MAAFCLPAFAVAADALIRRWRLACPVVFALLLVGIPGNVDPRRPSVGGRAVPGWVPVRQNVVQSEGRVRPTGCQGLRTSRGLHLGKGQTVTIGGGPVRVTHFPTRRAFFDFFVYDPRDGTTFTAPARRIDLYMSPTIRRSPSGGPVLELSQRVSSHSTRFRNPPGLNVSEYFSIPGRRRIAVQGQDLLDRLGRPGPNAGHTGWPFTIVSVTTT